MPACPFNVRARLAIGVALLAAAAPALAAVLALAPATRGDNLRVVDVATANATALEAPSCCAVQSGSVAADTAHDRVYFLANRSDGVDLYTFGYGTGGAVSSVPLGGVDRVTHLAYDVGTSRLLGFAAPAAGGIEVVAVSPGSGSVAVLGSGGSGCCTLRAGVIALQAGTLYAVGRRSTDATEQLLAFSATNGTLQNAWDLGGERIAALVADGSALYALSTSATATTRVGTFAFAPAFAFNPIGSGASDCCFVLAGSATIDHANNALVALTRASSTPGPFAIRAFSLASGAVTLGRTLRAMGLFEDSVVLFDRIFADDFEGNAFVAARPSR